MAAWSVAHTEPEQRKRSAASTIVPAQALNSHSWMGQWSVDHEPIAGPCRYCRPVIGHSRRTIRAGRAVARAFTKRTELQMDFLAVNPRFPGAFRYLQKIKYVRTVVTSIAYLWELFRCVPNYDVLHIFSASYWSFLLAPTPAILIGKLYGRKTVLNYHSGEAEDHLTRWKSAVKTL